MILFYFQFRYRMKLATVVNALLLLYGIMTISGAYFNYNFILVITFTAQ